MRGNSGVNFGGPGNSFDGFWQIKCIEFLKAYRKAHGMSLNQFANFLNVGETYYNGIESGRMFPSVENLYNIMQKCNVIFDATSHTFCDRNQFIKHQAAIYLLDMMLQSEETNLDDFSLAAEIDKERLDDALKGLSILSVEESASIIDIFSPCNNTIVMARIRGRKFRAGKKDK